MSLKNPRGALLSVDEAAERLGLSSEALYREVRNRRIRVMRIGRRIRLYEAWIDEYIAAHTTEPDGDIKGQIASASQSVERPLGVKDLIPRGMTLRN